MGHEDVFTNYLNIVKNMQFLQLIVDPKNNVSLVKQKKNLRFFCLGTVALNTY